MDSSILSLHEYRLILQHDFMSFAERAYYELHGDHLKHHPHIEYMAAQLDAFMRGLIRRLIVNAPPRGLKSFLASVALPAFYLGHHPERKVACVSYGADLAEDFGRQTLRLMRSPWYQRLFPRTRLSERQAAHHFETTAGGGRFATSVGGAFTGWGADLIIVDDPTKADDALSEPRRSAANMWFDNTLQSRLDNKQRGGIAIIMQRQHQDDLVGHVLERGGWEVVSFPAIATQDESFLIKTPLGQRTYTRRAGEALHPERESLETLIDLREHMSEFTFSAQYEQAPIPLEGSIVKTQWLRFYKPGEQPADFDRVVFSWDTANKTADLNDYSVCTAWGVADKYFYLLDVFRERLTYPDLKRKVIELAKPYSNATILIEDKASGTQLIQDLQHEIYGVKAYEPPAGVDKAVRLYSQTTMFEQGFVLLPESAPWLYEYIAELTGFPGTRYDDQVDSTTQALAYMRESDTLAIWAKLGRLGGSDQRLSRPAVIPWFGPFGPFGY